MDFLLTIVMTDIVTFVNSEKMICPIVVHILYLKIIYYTVSAPLTPVLLYLLETFPYLMSTYLGASVSIIQKRNLL